METIYRTTEGREALLAFYDRHLAKLPTAVRSRTVDTELGPTHVLEAGPQGIDPTVLLHGANGSAVLVAAGLHALTDRHHCIFVDVPGEPNRSSERRPNKTDATLGRWMRQLLDGLGLVRVAMLGISGGGYSAMRCCASIPERVGKLVLIVPEGYTRPRMLPWLKDVLWPMIRYRMSPSPENARRFVSGMCTRGAPIPDVAIEHMMLVLDHVRSVATLAPMFTAEELRRFEGPVLLLAGGADIVFPGEPTIARAEQVIRNLHDAVLVPDANHIDSRFYEPPLLDRIRDFLAARP